MDLEKLTLGDRIVAGGFVAFFISLFLPWFSFSTGDFGFGVGGFSADASGWDVGFLWSTFPLLLGIVMVAQIAIDRFTTTDLPEIPVSWGQVHLGLGGLAAALVVLKLLIGEEFFDRSWGLFIAVIAAGALAAGGFFKFKEENEGAGSGGGTAAPPQQF